MKYCNSLLIRCRLILLIVCALGLSVVAGAQSRVRAPLESASMNNNDNDDDEDNDKSAADANDDETEEEASFAPERKVSRVFKMFTADYGTSTIKAKQDTSQNKFGNGPTWAIGGQLCFQLNPKEKIKRLFFATGAELRNFNIDYMSEDNAGVVHDRIHYWYIGIPLGLQYVNTRHLLGVKNDVNLYAQAGFTVGFKTMISERSDNDNSGNNWSTQYASVILQPNLSVGVSYAAKGKVVLLAPYFGYVVNNLSSQSGVENYLLHYGVRFSLMFSK